MKKSKLALLVLSLTVILFSGCTRSVPLVPKEISAGAKAFNLPSKGKAGLYVYRDSFLGKELKKDVWLDKRCLGETANQVFFYTSIEGDKVHILSTESEFSDNGLSIKTDSGKNYYVRQYIKMGVVVEGAAFEVVDEEKAQKSILELDMAVQGSCSH